MVSSVIDRILKPKETDSIFFISVLGFLMAITSLSTDIYLPAMPDMRQDLSGDAELTITGFLLGFSFAQLIWGPISDSIGRKKPLLLGLILFILGSIGCALSQSILQIVIFRVIQAFGACVGPMLSRAMVRDVFGRTKAAEKLSTLMILMAIAPIIGPWIGGQLIKFTSWHSIFWLLSVIGLLMLIAILKLPETLSNSNKSKDTVKGTFAKYKQLLGNTTFMRYTLCVTFYYVGVYAFVTGSPAVYISYFNISPEYYSYLFAVNILGIMSLSFLNRFLVKLYSLNKLLIIATTIAMLGGVLLFIVSRFEILGIYGILISVFCFMAMNGIVAACTTAAALDKVPHMAGAASALLGSLQYGSGILSSVLLALFASKNGDPITMGSIIAFFSILAALTMYSIQFVKKDKHL